MSVIIKPVFWVSDKGLYKPGCAVTEASYHKVLKFSDAKIFCCNLLKIQTKTLNIREFHQKGAN